MVSILTFSANAERFVNYEFQEALIDINDNVVTSSNDINGVSAVGFVCNNGFTDSSGERICTDLGSSLWDGNVITTSDNKMQLTYPTQLQSQYGYVVFFFKDGFIPWEQTPNWAGTDYRDPQGPLIKYLAKKDFCSAPISPISITNEDDPSLPIIIGVEVDVDAHTRSALESKGPIEEVPDNSLETNTNIQFSDPKDTVLALHETLQKGDIEGHLSYGNINYLFEERSAFAKECKIEIIEVRYKVHPYSGEQSTIVVHKAFYNDKLSHVMFTTLGWKNNKWIFLNNYGREAKETLLINKDLINLRNSSNKEPMHW